MRRKHSLSYRILRWIVIAVSLFFVIASLCIEPYWHVDISVWKAIVLIWGALGLYGVIEKAVSREYVLDFSTVGFDGRGVGIKD